MLLSQLNLDSPELKGYVAMAIGLLGLAYLTMRASAKKRKDPVERAPFSGLAQQRAVERQMQNLLVEMAEMARQITGQLDTRAAKLEELIRQADQRIAAGGFAPDRATAGGDVATVALADPATGPHAEVFKLAADGLDAAAISRRLGRPRGEIDLILALRPPATEPDQRIAS